MRNAFHMSMTARRILRHFFGPSQAKNSSRLASERSLPPNQMGRPRSRSLTTMRYSVTLADGDLVDTNNARRRATSSTELLPHVLLVQLLDSAPIEMEFLGHRLNSTVPATATDIVGKPLGVKRVVCQPLQSLALHAAALAAPDPANRELQVNPLVPTRQVADRVEDADHKTCDRHVHKHRSAFFSTTAERDDHCVGVTEDTANMSQRDEARKPVDIVKSFDFTHPNIVTSFRRQEKWTSSRKTERFLALKGKNLPTRFHDEPEKYVPFPNVARLPRTVLASQSHCMTPGASSSETSVSSSV